MSALASYLKQRHPSGMAYRDAAILCTRLFGTADGVPENLLPLTKVVIADAFAKLAKNGWVTELNDFQPYAPSASSHEVTDRGHWIEIMVSLFSKEGLKRFDGVRGEELARQVGFTHRP